MPSPFVSQYEGARSTPVGFDQIEPGALAEIVAAVARTDRQPWRFDFRTNAIDSADWTVTAGSGHAVSASTGNLVITTGTTASTTTTVRSTRTFRVPMRASVSMILSQRIANQEFYVELVNNDGTVFARWKHDGVTNTAGKVEVSSGSAAVNQTLNSAVTTSATSAARLYEIEAAMDEVNFRDRTIDTQGVATDRALRSKNIPHPDDDLYLQFRAVNLGTAPATTTTMTIEFGYVQDEHQLAAEVVGGRGNFSDGAAIPVRPTGLPAAAASNARIGLVGKAGIWYDVSSTVLAAAGTITGTARDLMATATATAFASANYPGEFRSMAVADQAGTLYLEISTDNVNWRRIVAEPATTTGTGGLYVAEIRHYPVARYARSVYVNGGTLQTQFNLVEATLAA